MHADADQVASFLVQQSIHVYKPMTLYCVYTGQVVFRSCACVAGKPLLAFGGVVHQDETLVVHYFGVDVQATIAVKLPVVLDFVAMVVHDQAHTHLPV